MKTTKLKLIGITLLTIVACVALTGSCAMGPFGPGIDPRLQHAAKITVKVVDDDGNPIPKSQVTISTFSHWQGGDNFGTDVDKESKGITDENGLCSLELFGKTGEYGCYANVPAGYYGADGAGYTFTNSDLGRWLPWNPTVKIVALKIGVQVPMYARKVWIKNMPAKGKPCGFDLMVGDWVAPYGKGGTSDFIFQFDQAPGRTITNRYGPSKLFDNKLTIHFSNDGDGIQPLVAIPSELKSSRLAPLEGYQPVLTKRRAREEITDPTPEEKRNYINARTISDYQSDTNYFFRVRTKPDGNGNIANALYGKIYGEFDLNVLQDKITFIYYLNPEPNSRNMEFNTRSNLFKKLKSLEQVSAP